MIEIENMVDERQQKIERIADFYGDKQLWKLAEECGELIQALSKYVTTGDKNKSIEEIADVRIMLAQIEYILNIEDDVEPMIDYKIDRTLKIIDKRTDYREQILRTFLGRRS